MRLSTALQVHADRAPLDAALQVAHRNEEDKGRFFALLATVSRDTQCRMLLDRLHRYHPQLGASVRCWPRLASVLEAEAPELLPRARDGQTKYRLAIHMSLWRVLTELPELGWTNERIARALDGAKL